MPWTVTPDGRTWVLLNHRSLHVQAGGTWSTFGGAIDDGETPWHAAMRETSEEIEGIDVRLGVVAAELEVPCEHGCGWSYTTFAVRVWNDGADYLPSAWVVPGRSAWETAGLAWVPADEIAAHSGLHPGLHAAWSSLHSVICGSRSIPLTSDIRVGIDTSTATASMRAVLSAVNRSRRDRPTRSGEAAFDPSA